MTSIVLENLRVFDGELPERIASSRRRKQR